MKQYYRVQRKGRSIFGHESSIVSKDVKLPGVFAFEEPSQLFQSVTWLRVRKSPAEFEMIVFNGHLVFRPEDSEGVLISPTKELVRVPLNEWLLAVGAVES